MVHFVQENGSLEPAVIVSLFHRMSLLHQDYITGFTAFSTQLSICLLAADTFGIRGVSTHFRVVLWVPKTALKIKSGCHE
jgi:hypothetical protein